MMVNKKPQAKKPVAHKKADSKTVSQQKRRRRQWITFLRMCRYGVNNFTRNAWLTIAATAIMTITLLTVFVGVVSHRVMTDTVSQLRNEVKMSIYLKTDATEEQAQEVRADLLELDSVLDVSIKSPEDARSDFIDDNAGDAGTLDALKEATNAFPWTLSIKVQDINDTSELSTFVKEDEMLKEAIDENRPPSFAGDRRDAIASIGRAANFAQQASIIASAVFVAISILIIFNTIRMAIFNRREEIQMMKLIGAESSFIRGPFIVEAIVYGFFAALIASGLGYGLLVVIQPYLAAAEVNVQPTINLLTYYAGFAILAMILVGGLIGVISSLLATRRYLRGQS